MLSVNGVLLKVDKSNVGRIVSRIQMAVTTTVEEIDLETTCRVCLVKQEPADLFCLFGLNKMFEDLSIASAILDCFGVELKENEEFPKYVCIKCASNTLQSYTFKKCLKKCQGFLEERRLAIVKKHVEGIDTEDNILQAPKDIKSCDSFVTTYTSDHSYNLQFSDKDNDDVEEPFLSCILDDHDYCKNQSIGKDKEIDNLHNNCENKAEAEDSSDLVNINKNEVITETLNATKSKEIKRNNINITKTEPYKWWCKEAGPPYDCKICGRKYGVRFHAFYMHARMHRIKKQPCSHCGKVFTRDKLQIHMRIHTNEKPYACDRCPKRFAVLGNLTRHLRCHTGEKLFVCDICGKALTQSSSLLNHKQVHARKTLYVCVYCGKTFSSDGSHRSHLKLHHKNVKSVKSDEDNSEGNYPCTACGKVFRKAIALRIHSRIHIDSEKIQCSLCFKKFKSELNYQIHTTLHELSATKNSTSENKDWPCEFCTEVFKEKSALETHILTHKARPFVCNICDKSYFTKVTLMQHLRQHTDEKPYTCSTCCKTFRYAATLKQHVRIHTGEKPYKCEVCSRLFAQQQQLISHSFTHTGERKYVCPYCGKAFALNGNLTVHKRRHTGETPYVCDQCGKGFFDSSSLKKHKSLHINETAKVETF